MDPQKPRRPRALRPFLLPQLRRRPADPLPPAGPRRTPELPDAGLLLMRLASALHRYGAPTHRLEETLEAISAAHAVEAQFLVTPTSVIASVGPLERQQSYLVRLQPGEIDLEKLSRLYSLVEQLLDGSIEVREATARVDQIVADPSPYGSLTTTLSLVVATGTAAIAFGGGWAEAAVAATIGALLGGLLELAGRFRTLGGLLLVLAALMAALVSRLSTLVLDPVVPFVPMLAGLIVLLPGLSLTVAMSELAHSHLVSGTARLMGALVSFVQLGFGVALGSKLGAVLAPGAAAASPAALPPWVLPLSLPLSALSFAVLFRARRVDILAITVAALVAYGGAKAGVQSLGAELGSFGGAFALGVTSNLIARWRHQPTAVTSLPGMLLLVPGSLGFRSLDRLLGHDVLGGVETAFAMVLVAMSLVAGLFLANLTVPSRRLL